MLQYQNTRSLLKVGIVFQHFRARRAADKITHKNVVFREFVVAVVGNLDLATVDQCLSLVTCRYEQPGRTSNGASALQ